MCLHAHAGQLQRSRQEARHAARRRARQQRPVGTCACTLASPPSCCPHPPGHRRHICSYCKSFRAVREKLGFYWEIVIYKFENIPIYNTQKQCNLSKKSVYIKITFHIYHLYFTCLITHTTMLFTFKCQTNNKTCFNTVENTHTT